MVLSIGSRVSVKGNAGYVRYIGKTQFQPGDWIGIELDDPVGKNNGSVLGIRYFECTESSQETGLHGVFAKPEIVKAIDDESYADKVPVKDRKLESIIQKLEDKIRKLQANSKLLNENIQLLENSNSELMKDVARLEGDLELATVDKELLDAEKEELIVKFSDLDQNYKTLLEAYEQLKEELKLSQEIDEELEDPNSDGYKLILKKNKLLELALLKLQNNFQEKEQNHNEELASLKEDLSRLQVVDSTHRESLSKFGMLEKQNRELQEQLASLNDSANMIENLTEKNLEASAQIAQLEKSIDDLEELHKLDQEMERDFTEIQADLEKRLEVAQFALQEKDIEIKRINEKNDDLEKIIIRKQIPVGSGNNATTSGGTVEAKAETAIQDRVLGSSASQSNDLDLKLKKLLVLANEQFIQEFYRIVEKVPKLEDSSDHILMMTGLKRVEILLDHVCQFLVDSSYKELDTVSMKSYDNILLKFANLHNLRDKARGLDYFSTLIKYSKTEIERAEHIFQQCQSFSGNIETMLKDENFRLDLIDFDLKIDTPEVVTNFCAYLRRVSTSLDMVEFSLLSINLSLRGISLLFPEGRLKSSQHLISLKAILDGLKIVLKQHLDQVVEAKKEKKFAFNEIPQFSDKFLLETCNLTKKLSSDLGLVLTDKDTDSKAQLVDKFHSDVFLSPFAEGMPLFKCLEVSYKKIESLTISFRAPDYEINEFQWLVAKDNSTSTSSNASEIGMSDDRAVIPIGKVNELEKISELKLKIEVLDAKLKKSEADELKLLEYKDELDSLKLNKESLLHRISQLDLELEERDRIIEKNKRQGIIGTGDFESIFEQRQFIEKATLISEIGLLRDALRSVQSGTKARKISSGEDLAWLKKNPRLSSRSIKRDTSPIDARMTSICEKLLKINADYTLVSVDRESIHTKAAAHFTASLADDLRSYKKHKLELH